MGGRSGVAGLRGAVFGEDAVEQKSHFVACGIAVSVRAEVFPVEHQQPCRKFPGGKREEGK
jgi:hypothetical protein